MAIDPRRGLLLVPTQYERDLLAREVPEVFAPGTWLGVATIGFGPIAAAASTAGLIVRYGPERIVLAGIAGTYGDRSDVGSALTFGSVFLDGVGAGEGRDFVAPAAMGLPQWRGPGAPVFDRLELADEGPGLVTACAASSDGAMAARRRERFEGGAAEDMEAFGVALAASMSGVPVSVIRGISNVAGERDRALWSVEPALASVARELRRTIALP